MSSEVLWLSMFQPLSVTSRGSRHGPQAGWEWGVSGCAASLSLFDKFTPDDYECREESCSVTNVPADWDTPSDYGHDVSCAASFDCVCEYTPAAPQSHSARFGTDLRSGGPASQYWGQQLRNGCEDGRKLFWAGNVWNYIGFPCVIFFLFLHMSRRSQRRRLAMQRAMRPGGPIRPAVAMGAMRGQSSAAVANAEPIHGTPVDGVPITTAVPMGCATVLNAVPAQQVQGYALASPAAGPGANNAGPPVAVAVAVPVT